MTQIWRGCGEITRQDDMSWTQKIHENEQARRGERDFR